MGLLIKISDKFKEINKNMVSRRTSTLLKDTEDVRKRFKTEAKLLGIDLGNLTQKNYYEVLGIKYTNDSNEIRRAYLGMVKRYHPDVNLEKSAARKTTEINEAYAVLKDRKSKSDYDASFAKGKNRMGTDTTKSMTEAFMKRYSEERSKEFKEFNESMSSPQTMDAVNAAIDRVLDWSHAFKTAKSHTFGKIIDCGNKIRKLKSINKSLLASSQGEAADRLSSNMEELEPMDKAFKEIEAGINAVSSGIRERIIGDERKVAAKLGR
ncbi:DnaJ domain-containing protein [Candidatus Marsarchaeota archaeon]|nr:DnaJ domain-containing protein [Candidatus Marsarchaeota archaeon]